MYCIYYPYTQYKHKQNMTNNKQTKTIYLKLEDIKNILKEFENKPMLIKHKIVYDNGLILEVALK